MEQMNLGPVRKSEDVQSSDECIEALKMFERNRSKMVLKMGFLPLKMALCGTKKLLKGWRTGSLED